MKINQHNDAYLKHGYWELYWVYHGINRCYKGNYNNHEQDGYWEWYDNDKLIKKNYYI